MIVEWSWRTLDLDKRLFPEPLFSWEPAVEQLEMFAIDSGDVKTDIDTAISVSALVEVEGTLPF